MSSAVHYRMLLDSEVEDASELARRVFDEFIASQCSVEGQEEFRRYAAPSALRERHRAGCLTFAAERNGRLVGMLHLGDGNHIHMLFVEGSSQRQGVGRRLIGAVKEYALARQPPARILTVGASPNAIDPYRRMRFVPVGHEQISNGIRYIPMELEIGCHTSAPVMTPPLEPPDSFHLSAAQGWLELGNHLEANEELECIAPQLRAHPDVLEVRWHVYADAKKWDACVDIGKSLVELAPNRASGWLDRAYALRRSTCGGLQAAWEALLPAAGKFTDVNLIPYNLACYACQMGRLPEARNWLKRAFEIAEEVGMLRHVRLTALDDPDLEPLWREIGNAGSQKQSGQF